MREAQQQLERYIKNAVNSAETDLERLFFLGSLRDAYTGRYLHEGLNGLADANEIHSMLQNSHRVLFLSVLKLSLLQLSRELRGHFVKLNEPERETSLLWLEIEPFRDLIPTGCPLTLRELFISQVRSALEVLSRVPDWKELGARDASQPPQPVQSLRPRWIN